MGKWDTGFQNEEDEAFSSLHFLGNMILSKILGLLINRMVGRAYRRPLWLSGKDTPAVEEMRVHSLDWEDPLEKEMATHSTSLQPHGLVGLQAPLSMGFFRQE